MLSVKYFLSKQINNSQKKQIKKLDSTRSTSKANSLFAIGSNVDLGTVFGTAVAIQVAGLGVLLWMFVGAILSISIRVIEVFLSHKYRVVSNDGKVCGGPQYYILQAFKGGRGVTFIGKLLRNLFVIGIIFSTLFSPQINQTVNIINYFSGFSGNYNWLLSLLISGFIIIMLSGSFGKVIQLLHYFAPPVGYIYTVSCLLILAFSANNILPTIKNIFIEGLSVNKGIGFLFFVITLGCKRAFFCLETGMGASGITHANSINNNSLSEAVFSAIVPMISIFLVALCSGLIVGVTNADTIGQTDGVQMLVYAFETVHYNMRFVLLLVIPLFALSTSIAWAHYGKTAWNSLFGEKTSYIYTIMLLVAYWSCGQSNNFTSILDAADVVNLSVTIPNIIAIYILSAKYLNGISSTFSKSIKKIDKELYQTF
ncbi:MAG: alanine:cation symporter family protein [Alphaproteobacteria bacterium]|nr:alanine:cation symporter family protein [Rickettsiales bacterium]